MVHESGTLLIDLDAANDPQSESVTEIVESAGSGIPQIYPQQCATTTIPVQVVEFDAQSNSFVLPIAGYFSQQLQDDIPQSTQCVPLVPVSSLLLPVHEANEKFSSVYGSYTSASSSVYPLLPHSTLSDGVHVTCNGALMEISSHRFLDKQATDIYPITTVSQVTSEDPAVQPLPPDLIDIDTRHDTAVVTTSSEPTVFRRKRGRPRKLAAEICSSPKPTPAIYQPYHPSHFWCPLCDAVYGDSACPIHPISVEGDSLVPSYARLTLPANLELIDNGGGIVKVIAKRRFVPSTRFGPVVAPMVTETELRCNPEWLPHCPFRVDPLNASEPVRFLKLSDESECNWMMFVKRVSSSVSRLRSVRPVPNCMAYQLGSEGVYFLTTKVVRPGDELVVGYALPYAIQSSLVEGDVEAQRDARVEARTAICSTKPRFTRPVPSDEIHCFRCSITFESEEAFRVHCLGHPEESVLRGFADTEPSNTTVSSSSTRGTDGQVQAGTGYIKVRKPSAKAGTVESDTVEARTLYLQSTLQCSLCFTIFQGLSELVEHTDAVHSVREPRTFKLKPTDSGNSPIDWSETDQLVTSTAQGAEPLITKSESLYDLDDAQPPSDSSTDNFIVVELTNASQNLLEQTYWAYACGQCHQRFPNMLALEQHKEELHNNWNQTAERHLQLDATLPQTGVMEPMISIATSENHADRADAKSQCQIPAVVPQFQDSNPSGLSLSSLVDETHCHLVSQRTEEHASESMKPETGPEEISCLSCLKSFRSRSALAVHVHSRVCVPTAPSVRSAGCSKQQTPQKLLRPYVSRVPGRTRPKLVATSHRQFLRCVVCGEQLSSRQSWHAHHVKHRRASDKLYPCEVCGGSVERAYKTFDQLRRHVRQVHTNQIFPCPYCESTFGRRKDLTNHLTRHTGRRDFACPYDGCGKAFSRKDKLKNHMKLHVKERKSPRKSKWWTHGLSDENGLPDAL